MWLFKPNIAKMESCSDVNGIIKASAHRNRRTALAALAALGRLGDKAAADALRCALKKDDDDKRKTAAESLVAIGRSVTDIVAAALNDDNYRVRDSVAGALEQILSKGKWDELGKRRVGDLAAAGEWKRLSTLALRTTDQNMHAFIQDQMRNCTDPEVIGALVAEVLSPKGKKDSAIELLAACDKATTGNIIAKSIFDLKELMHDWDKDWKLRKAAAISLKELGWSPDTDDDKIAVRLLLSEKGFWPKIGLESVPYLLKAVECRTRIPETALIEVCGRLKWLKDPRCVEPLIQDLRARYIPCDVRTAIISTLGAIPDRRVIPVLLDCLSSRAHDHELSYSQSASDEVREIAPILARWKCIEAVPYLIARLRHGWDSVIIFALGELQDNRATQTLIEIMRKRDLSAFWRSSRGVRVSAARALHKIGDETTVCRTPFGGNYNEECVFFYDGPESDFDGDPTSGYLECELKDIKVTFFKQSTDRPPKGNANFCKGCMESRM